MPIGKPQSNCTKKIMLLLNFKIITLLLKLKNDCNTQSCLLLNLKVIVLYNHAFVKIQETPIHIRVYK